MHSQFHFIWFLTAHRLDVSCEDCSSRTWGGGGGGVITSQKKAKSRSSRLEINFKGVLKNINWKKKTQTKSFINALQTFQAKQGHREKSGETNPPCFLL